jgi:hypothetical protein
MFHINEKKLIKEAKESGAARVAYYEGQCMTCENSPNREARAACPKADFFEITTKLSSSSASLQKHICKNWILSSEIVSCFKKNQLNEAVNPIQNGNKINKYHK